jgi:hypothetical protein
MEQRVKTKNISYFNPPVSNTKPDEKVSYVDVYQLVTSGTLVEITNEIRSLCNPDLVKDLKATKLPHITSSGIFYTRCDDGLKYHNETICIDIDGMESEEQLQETKRILIEDPCFYTLMLFRSPSGNGLKWFTPIDLSQCGHRKWFEAIRNYLYQTYGIVADEKCVNTSRSCFLCYDAEAYACEEIMNNINNNKNEKEQQF